MSGVWALFSDDQPARPEFHKQSGRKMKILVSFFLCLQISQAFGFISGGGLYSLQSIQLQRRTSRGLHGLCMSQVIFVSTKFAAGADGHKFCDGAGF